MKRSEIRHLLKDGVDNLMPVVEFGSGLITDFNSIRNHKYPAAWQDIKPVKSDVSMEGLAPIDSWDISLTIGMKDKTDSAPDQYECIIDKCDEIAQKLQHQYRAVVSGYKQLTMESVSREPFVKKHADCITGVTLSFILVIPDTTRICYPKC